MPPMGDARASEEKYTAIYSEFWHAQVEQAVQRAEQRAGFRPEVGATRGGSTCSRAAGAAMDRRTGIAEAGVGEAQEFAGEPRDGIGG